MKSHYFSIGEMAKITGVSRKTLIFYDRQEIFKPSYINDKGYRFYDLQQVDTMNAINMFRELGMPLKDIRDYLDHRNKKAFIHIMDEMEEVMVQRILKTKNYLEVIRYKRQMIKEGMAVEDPNKVFIAHKKEEPLFLISLSKEEVESADFTHVFVHMEEEMKRLGIIGKGVYAKVGQHLLEEGYKGELSAFAMGLSAHAMEAQNDCIPEGDYVCAYHQGSYDSTPDTYKHLFNYIKANNLTIDGDAYECDIANFFTEKDEADYMVEIFIKVRLSSES